MLSFIHIGSIILSIVKSITVCDIKIAIPFNIVYFLSSKRYAIRYFRISRFSGFL